MSPFVRLKRFRTSFRSRLFLIFTLFTGIIAVTFVFVLITGEIRNYRERSTEKAQLLASLLAGNVTLPLYSENRAELTRQAAAMLATPRVARIVITNNDSRVLVDIKAPSINSEAPVITASLPVTARTSTPSAEMAVTGVVPPTAANLGTVALSIDAGDRDATIRTVFFRTGGIALLFWIAVVAACYPVLKRVTRSFNTLTKGLEGMMEGDFSAKIIIDRDDEAGRAALAVNRLAAALEERDIENRNLQEELVKAMQLEVQEERQKIMAKLIQTNRMTSLGLLISSIAHNINTPNGVIMMAGQHLDAAWKDALSILEQVTSDEGNFSLGGTPFGVARKEILASCESVLNNAKRVELVINDLRAYNLGERNELASGVSVNHVIEEALTIIRAHSRQGEITISLILGPDLPTVTGNQSQLEQVVVNLLLNAMQSMSGKSGTITVRTGYYPENAEVRIIVMDQGHGIAPEVKKHLFEAFFTTRIDKGGSGLGLYISNFIVSEHRGHLTIESEHHAGTVATVHLPVTPSAS